jgi:tetratricopeptide (TPR) repeat protein
MTLGNVGATYEALGDYPLAIEHHNQAIIIWRQIGKHHALAISFGQLGNTYKANGDHQQAIENYLEAVRISRDVNDIQNQGITSGNLGEAYFATGKVELAEESFRTAIRLCGEATPGATGQFRGSLARLIARQGKYDEARNLLDKAEPQVEPFPITYASFLCMKGEVQYLLGEPDDAANSLAQAQAIADDLKAEPETELGRAIAELSNILEFPPASNEEDEERALAILEGEQLLELMKIEREHTNYAEAEEIYARVQSIFLRWNHRSGEAAALGILGGVFRNQGKLQDAKSCYEQAIDITRIIGDKHNESISLWYLGNISRIRGNAKQALNIYQEALQIATQVGNHRLKGCLLGSIGDTYTLLGDSTLAIENLNDALRIAREIEDKPFELSHMGNLGVAYEAINDYSRAQPYFAPALEIAQMIGDRCNEGIFLANIGKFQAKEGLIEEAEQSFRKSIQICDEVIPAAASTARGSLALLLAQRGQLAEALSVLEAGDSQPTNENMAYTTYLCCKAQVQHMAGDKQAALVTFDRIQQIVKELEINPDSETVNSITELSELLGVKKPDLGGYKEEN